MKDMNDRAAEAYEDSKRWFPNAFQNQQLTIAIHALGVNGEAGEVAEAVKKWLRGSLAWLEFIDKVKEEIVDVMVYCYNLAAELDLDLEKLYDVKRKFNDERFTKERQEREAWLRSSPGSLPEMRIVSPRVYEQLKDHSAINPKDVYND